MTQHRLKPGVIFMTLILAILSLALTPAVTFASKGSGISSGKPQAIAESDVRLTTNKLTGKVTSQVKTHVVMETYPTYDYLNTSVADWILEPPASGTDFYGNHYTDWHFADLCGPAAAAVSLDYWNNVNTRNVGIHSYSTTSSTTWWGDYNRGAGGFHNTSYMMYLATQVKPPAYVTPGIMSWDPDQSTVQDMVNALNWESSSHGTINESFYAAVWASGLTLAILQAHVTSDIAGSGVPPIVLVNDAFLPDWANSPYRGKAGHYVAIIGYNNSASTFTYEETCGPYSCGTSSYGQHTISQQQLLNGILNTSSFLPYGGALIW